MSDREESFGVVFLVLTRKRGSRKGENGKGDKRRGCSGGFAELERGWRPWNSGHWGEGDRAGFVERLEREPNAESFFFFFLTC